ncbi:pectate lyase-domain-containing protein [Phyllosticta citrichinensis]|uniref:Pectate lyase n=1 Tax=Phyllosticta citrichinensis TaxID=1130410 RepID=A0ABR1XZH7_9PEZI
MKVLPFFALLGIVTAAPEGLERRQLPIPQAKGKQTLQQAMNVQGNFDGGMKVYGRGLRCQPNKEGGRADAVFVVQPGGTLSNVIIGPDIQEGIRCLGGCTLNNCWFQKVCEDAITGKGNGDVIINGGGATGASDKVLQFNGRGTMYVKNFICIGFDTMYRACGNCGGGQQGQRNVVLQGVKAQNGKRLVGINSNFGDVAKISNTCATNVEKICVESSGTGGGGESSEQGSGSSKNCQVGQVPQC